jgi:hypothetical protein
MNIPPTTHMGVLCMQRTVTEDEGTKNATMGTTHTTTVSHPKIFNYKIAGASNHALCVHF